MNRVRLYLVPVALKAENETEGSTYFETPFKQTMMLVLTINSGIINNFEIYVLIM